MTTNQIKKSSALQPRGVQIAPMYADIIGREAAQLRRVGRSIIPMHFGQPTQGTPPAATQAARQALSRDENGYIESRELIERIAKHYLDTYKLLIDPNRIVLTIGASAGLVALFTSLFTHGDRIALCRPGYPAYRNTLMALGREPVEIDCGLGDNYRLNDALIRAVTPGVHGLVVASPANPTGAMLDRTALASIAECCQELRIRFISDEIYHGISFGEPAVSALEVDDNAIVVNSFSKLYRMPGSRLGWLVLPEAQVSMVSAYLINFFLTPPSLSQAMALAAFDELDNLTGAVVGYRTNRDLLIAAFRRMGITGLSTPDGAFYIYAEIGHLTQDSLAFCRQLLADTGIASAPGIDFDPIHGHQTIRFSFAVTTAEVKRAIALLEPWVAAVSVAKRPITAGV